MTSHIRHRRGLPFPDLIEPGEVAVDPVDLQLTVGGIDAAAGVKLPLLGVRIFSTLATYQIHDFVVHDGSILRAIVAVPPGPFEPADWELSAGAVDQVHTPLHGFNDGDNHTLLLHHTVDDASKGNTVDFLNFAGNETARLWTTGLVGDTLRIQSAGAIAIAANHIGFDDSANVLEAASGSVIVKADLTVFRSASPTTGVVGFGNTGTHYLYFDGADLESYTQHIVTSDPVADPQVATKHYVDAQIDTAITGGGAGDYLPLAGGTMTGEIVTARCNDLEGAESAGTILVMANSIERAGAKTPPVFGDSAAISFYIPGSFSANFGLLSDGNLYLGGGSYGAGVIHRLLTELDLTRATQALDDMTQALDDMRARLAKLERKET